VVLDALQATGSNAAAIIDSKYNGELFGVMRYKELPDDFTGSQAVIAIGDNAVRKKISQDSTHSFINVIHPSALISNHAKVGNGCMILHRSIIQAGAKIGNHVIINTAAQIDHDCEIGNYVHIGPGSVLCGSITIGEGTLIGAGSVIRPGVRVGSWATVGSGAVVVKDIPDYAIVVGNPGRIIKYIRP
jgi:sugar O-acyltransferase (sialic acid O-acetyltransferase NeuD family)